jgi:magnesium transporter
MVSVNQNDEVKKSSAWAAIPMVPTIIAGTYGMNFEHMPELAWTFGYPPALVLIAVLSVLLYWDFERSGWLWW